MQIAMILSDLKSLSVCVWNPRDRPCHRQCTALTDSSQGHEEALALVNVHKSTAAEDAIRVSKSPAALPASDQQNRPDPQLQRARDLVEVHYGVKLKYLEEGLDTVLQKAREDVRQVHDKLLSKSSA